jgi:uncharacterized membrane protein
MSTAILVRAEPVRRRLLGHAEAPGLLLLGLALVFNGLLLAPEWRTGRVPLNDAVFHRAAAERLLTHFERGEPFLDPWVSEWSLGYPVWRTYQVLPHLAAAAALHLFRTADPASVFAALLYVLAMMLPATVYLGSRRLGLSPPAAGLAALLVYAPIGGGDFGAYGLGYGAVTWRGSGLFTQLVALHLLVPALGLTARALDTGRRRAAAAVFLAATALAHVIFGYVAFVSALLLAMVGRGNRRPTRLVRLASLVGLALPLLAFFAVPLLMGAGEANHSRWEPGWKWDSFGAPRVLSELVSGRLLDFGRPPFLTALLAVGVVGALLARRDPLARRLLVFSTCWLALFFGRETWGHALWLVGMPADFHLHRLQVAFELSAVLLIGYGLDRVWARLAVFGRGPAFAGAAVVASAILGIGRERAAYLEQNARWGEESLAAYEGERTDLESALHVVRALLDERPGRASAGLASTYGAAFRVGAVPVYAFLSRDHLDQASFLYHAMSKASDAMVLRDEARSAHDRTFGVRAVLAPADRAMPPHLVRRATFGRFAVYESSAEGYFGLVDVVAHDTGPSSAQHETNERWLKSRLPEAGLVIALDAGVRLGRAVGRWERLPDSDAPPTSSRGSVVGETRDGETYRARVRADRACHVQVKIGWHPDLRARVDGRPAVLVPVTPGFAAVAVDPGVHEIVVRYEPRVSRAALLLAGVAIFLIASRISRRRGAAHAEYGLIARVKRLEAQLVTPRNAATLALFAASIVALHPLLRGRLVAGHDATAYPPRLVQMERALAEGHVPPVWAPDLGDGHGQPLFAFAPPLVYLAGLPLRALSVGLSDALQVGLALLCAAGAAALYRLGRRLTGQRAASVAAAVTWLFAPYLALDLYVRAAFAEASALAMAPVALWALLRAIDAPGAGRVAQGAIAVGLVLLGHNAAALLVLPALVLVAVVLRPARGARLAGVGTIAAGLGLSAYFWYPALGEKGLVHTERLREGFLHWSTHFVEPWQLLWSAWGHGLSVEGGGDGMSFAVGPLTLALGLAGFFCAVRLPNTRVRGLAAVSLLSALAGVWLSTAASAAVWARVETLQYLAYPWRALLLPALFLPVLSTFVYARMGPRGSGAVAALVVAFNLGHTEPRGFLTFDDAYYAPASIAAGGIATTTREEYEPQWVETRPLSRAAVLVGREAPLVVTEVLRRAARQEFLVRSAVPDTVEAATFFYPGWTALVDGDVRPVTPLAGRGTITFDVPAGTHRVVLELRATPLQRVGQLASAVTAALLGLAVAAAQRRRSSSSWPSAA